MKERGRPFFHKEGNNEILPFEKMKEQRMRERTVRLERVRRALELRRYLPVANRRSLLGIVFLRRVHLHMCRLFRAFTSKVFWLYQEARWSTSFLYTRPHWTCGGGDCVVCKLQDLARTVARNVGLGCQWSAAQRCALAQLQPLLPVRQESAEATTL